MPSFDAVSEVNVAELDNALNQATREITTRYDFKGVKASIDREPGNVFLLKASTEERLGAVREVFLTRLAARGISLRSLEVGKSEESGFNQYKQTVKVIEGIAPEKAKKLTALIRDSKIKVQASIQGDAVRITGKKRDDLQEVIALLRSKMDELNLDLQFINFRD